MLTIDCKFDIALVDGLGPLMMDDAWVMVFFLVTTFALPSLFFIVISLINLINKLQSNMYYIQCHMFYIHLEYSDCYAHGLVVIGFRSVNQKLLDQAKLWLLDFLCCTHRHSTLLTLSQSTQLKLCTNTRWE